MKHLLYVNSNWTSDPAILCASPQKNIYESGHPVLKNYSLFTNFISIEAKVHKTLILYEIAVGSDKGLNLETIFQVYTFLIHPVEQSKGQYS